MNNPTAHLCLSHFFKMPIRTFKYLQSLRTCYKTGNISCRPKIILNYLLLNLTEMCLNSQGVLIYKLAMDFS